MGLQNTSLIPTVSTGPLDSSRGSISSSGLGSIATTATTVGATHPLTTPDILVTADQHDDGDPIGGNVSRFHHFTVLQFGLLQFLLLYCFIF